MLPGTWPVIIEKIIQQSRPILVLDLRASASHFIDFAIPLRPSQALLANDVVIVADSARALERGGER